MNNSLHMFLYCQALFESAEHQTRAALMILESKDTPTPKKQTKTATKSTKLPEMHPHISKEASEFVMFYGSFYVYIIKPFKR